MLGSSRTHNEVAGSFAIARRADQLAEIGLASHVAACSGRRTDVDSGGLCLKSEGPVARSSSFFGGAEGNDGGVGGVGGGESADWVGNKNQFFDPRVVVRKRIPDVFAKAVTDPVNAMVDINLKGCRVTRQGQPQRARHVQEHPKLAIWRGTRAVLARFGALGFTFDGASDRPALRIGNMLAADLADGLPDLRGINGSVATGSRVPLHAFDSPWRAKRESAANTATRTDDTANRAVLNARVGLRSTVDVALPTERTNVHFLGVMRSPLRRSFPGAIEPDLLFVLTDRTRRGGNLQSPAQPLQLPAPEPLISVVYDKIVAPSHPAVDGRAPAAVIRNPADVGPRRLFGLTRGAKVRVWLEGEAAADSKTNLFAMNSLGNIDWINAEQALNVGPGSDVAERAPLASFGRRFTLNQIVKADMQGAQACGVARNEVVLSEKGGARTWPERMAGLTLTPAGALLGKRDLSSAIRLFDDQRLQEGRAAPCLDRGITVTRFQVNASINGARNSGFPNMAITVDFEVTASSVTRLKVSWVDRGDPGTRSAGLASGQVQGVDFSHDLYTPF